MQKIISDLTDFSEPSVGVLRVLKFKYFSQALFWTMNHVVRQREQKNDSGHVTKDLPCCLMN